MEKTITSKKSTSATYAICVTALFMALNILMSSFGVPVPGLCLADALRFHAVLLPRQVVLLPCASRLYL